MKRFLFLTAVFFLLRFDLMAQDNIADTIFPRGTLVAAHFTGRVWVQPLVPQDSVFDLVAGCVTFSPGARSFWHTHHAGQILLITSGTGYTQEKGKPIRVVHKGDIVICPPNVEHWHGAAPGSYMSHISLNPNADKGVVSWLQPVTDEEYNGATNKMKKIMETIQHLDSKQKDIVGIAALMAVANIDQLKVYLGKGLDDGLTISEIKEVLVQLYAYCGFPRSLNGINAFMAVLDERKNKGIHDAAGKDGTPVTDGDKYEMGRKNLQMLTGVEETGPRKGANGFAPAIDRFLKEHLFADIFGRGVLSFQQRELVTISALAAMTGVEPQLQAHLVMGMNTGITVGQLEDVFVVVDDTIGAGAGERGRAILDKARNVQK